jgi:hypothetical protein
MHDAAFTSIDVPGPGKRGDYQTFETATQPLAYMLYSSYNSQGVVRRMLKLALNLEIGKG